MPNCHEMRQDEVYVCPDCGLELKVVKECRDAGKPASECGCHDDNQNACTMSCCGKELVKKSG
ncbi:MAG: hypothetical protein GF330_06010 [Candidatus Eisenbacteria bacterium]|nr:hypothetical protein [Candidatus Eisenbacteria bacterium]